MFHISLNLSHIKKVNYFSYKCDRQYKNCFNFFNIYNHFSDFNIECEWYFFATPHGKSVCDDIGGVVKKTTTKVSLQRLHQDQILTAEEMFRYCKDAISDKITFFFITLEEIGEKKNFLAFQFSKAATAPGTQEIHRVTPAINRNLTLFEMSSSNKVEIKKIFQSKKQIENENLNPNCGNHVICKYNNQKLIGQVSFYL